MRAVWLSGAGVNVQDVPGAADYGAKKIGRKKYKTNYKKGLKQQILYGIIRNCDMLMEQFQSVIQFPCSREEPGAKRP